MSMSSIVHKGLRMYINCLKMYFNNSLIMHEENTKKNNKRVVSLHVIEISLDLPINFTFDYLDFLKVTSPMNLLVDLFEAI